MKARALGALGALMLALGAWVAWPVADAAGGGRDALTAASMSPPASPVLARADQPAAARGLARVRSASRPADIRVLAGVGTPGFGVLALLRRPRFAPSVRLDTELWNAFASGPRGDLAALHAAIADRLARVGYESVHQCAWQHAEALALDRAAVADACVVLAVSAQAIGFAHLDAMAPLQLRTCGGAELRADGEGELWAWSESAFVGPHRATAGRLIPAAPGRALQVVGAPAPRVRFYSRFRADASSVCVLVAVPGGCQRAFTAATSSSALQLVPETSPAGIDPSRGVTLAQIPAATEWSWREEGEPFGAYLLRDGAGAWRVIAAVAR